MRELFPGITDDQLPPEAKARFFCKFQQDTLGVICERKLTCESCGWNPAVAEERKEKARAQLAADGGAFVMTNKERVVPK